MPIALGTCMAHAAPQCAHRTTAWHACPNAARCGLALQRVARQGRIYRQTRDTEQTRVWCGSHAVRADTQFVSGQTRGTHAGGILSGTSLFGAVKAQSTVAALASRVRSRGPIVVALVHRDETRDLRFGPVFSTLQRVLDVTCESLSCLTRRPGSPPSGQPRTRDPVACARRDTVSGA